MASPRNHYEVMGLKQSASLLDIRESYRRLAMALHPDKNPDEPMAVEIFQKLQEAYDVLRDADKRAAYDRQLGSQLRDPGYEIFQNAQRPAAQKAGGPVAKRGEDLRFALEVDLEALKNTPAAKEYRYTRLDRCPECRGTGHEASAHAKPVACEVCSASGLVDVKAGNMMLRQPCPNCHSGYVFQSNACQVCLGAGRMAKSRKIEVTIPAGTHPGSILRIPRGGHAGAWNGEFGDLMLEVKMALPAGVTTQGDDLHVTLPLDPITLIVGADVTLPNTDGRIKIAPATRPGERIVLKKRGLPKQSNPKDFGDLVVNIELEWPLILSSKQIKLLSEVRQTLDVATSTPDSQVARKLIARLTRKL